MRVGIIQSAYIPWRGYFDFIDSVDLFILLDDVKYPRARSWRNRNQIKFRSGLKWINVPLQKNPHYFEIDQVKISGDDWKSMHYKCLKEALNDSKFFYDVKKIYEEATFPNIDNISLLNQKFIEIVCRYYGIETRIIQSRKLDVMGAKTERLINILKKVGATSYLSGPAAKDYLDENLFSQNKIRLEYKTYEYLQYPQLWGDFEGTVSVLDLIANCGSNGKSYLKSNKLNIIAIN